MTKEQDKELYSFEVKSVKEVEEVTTLIDENTKEESKLVKKVKKETPTRIVIKRPTRRQTEKADLQFTIKMSELMKLGVLSRAMITKKYADTGGVLTDIEAQYLTSLYKRLGEKQVEFVDLSVAAQTLSEDGKKKLGEVTTEINLIRKEIAQKESEYSHIFQHSADMKAVNHVILWYSLMLTYVEEQKDGEAPVYTPYFKGDTFEEKLEDYYTKEEEFDTLYLQVRQKLAYFISFWYNGAIATRDDFVKLEKDIDAGK